MVERGFIVAGARILKRSWQIYVAHVFLFAIYIAEIAYVASSFDNPLYAEEMNALDFLKTPDVTIIQALLLKFKPANMDVLPLYIVLLMVFPLVLWLLIRNASRRARAFGRALRADLGVRLEFASWPNGHWYFNPFAWQLLFVFGAWCALGGATRLAPALRSPITVWLAIAYLLFCFGVTMTWYFPRLSFLIPHWLGEWMYPIDKTNLDVLRFAHFLALAALTVRFIPRDWPVLQSPWLRPAILCGQHSLEIFCLGVFLAFAAHFVMVEFYGGTAMQVLMSMAGILIMIGTALADLVVQTGRRPRLGNAQAAAGCRPCRRRGMKKWTALGRAVAIGAIVLCSAAARGEPADTCAVPSYLLFGDSLLDRVNAAVKKDKTLQIVALGRRVVDAARSGRP